MNAALGLDPETAALAKVMEPDAWAAHLRDPAALSQQEILQFVVSTEHARAVRDALPDIKAPATLQEALAAAIAHLRAAALLVASRKGEGRGLLDLPAAMLGKVHSDLIDVAEELDPVDDRPTPGDPVVMPFMGADASIVISSVPEEQPQAASGVWQIVDQYGETHLVERDETSWITLTSDMFDSGMHDRISDGDAALDHDRATDGLDPVVDMTGAPIIGEEVGGPTSDDGFTIASVPAQQPLSDFGTWLAGDSGGNVYYVKRTENGWFFADPFEEGIADPDKDAEGAIGSTSADVLLGYTMEDDVGARCWRGTVSIPSGDGWRIDRTTACLYWRPSHAVLAARDLHEGTDPSA